MAQQVHQASPLAAAAMGRTLTAAVLLAADFKTAFRLQVELDGSGPLGRVLGEVRTDGKIRARIDHPQVELDLRTDGKLDVGRGVGDNGYLRVIREDDWGRFESQVELVSGEIGEDLAQYYVQSEQIPSAVAVGVLINRDRSVKAAGGLVVQMLPGGESEAADIIAKFSVMTTISHRLAEGESPEDLLRAVLPAPLVWANPEPLEFRCRCSRDNSLKILQSLPEEEMDALIQQNGAEVVCNYCKTAYQFSANELRSG